jgi:hypothetical protein
MAHYALLDENNLVTEVITGINETELIDGLNPETWYENFRGQTCKRTSYNSFAGKRRNQETGHLTDEPGFRKNYAGIGYAYDPEKDAFIPPKDYPSWTLNETTCLWEAPVPYPEGEIPYTWNEETLSWE